MTTPSVYPLFMLTQSGGVVGTIIIDGVEVTILQPDAINIEFEDPMEVAVIDEPINVQVDPIAIRVDQGDITLGICK